MDAQRHHRTHPFRTELFITVSHGPKQAARHTSPYVVGVSRAQASTVHAHRPFSLGLSGMRVWPVVGGDAE